MRSECSELVHRGNWSFNVSMRELFGVESDDMLVIEEKSTCQWILMIQEFLKVFGWLADSFVLDFYQESHWDRLSSSWKLFLPKLTPVELASFIDLRNECGLDAVLRRGEIPPLGLLALRSTTKLLSLNRNLYVGNNHTDPPASEGVVQEFKKIFCRHVKPKKRHEIERLCQIVSQISKKSATTNVFDVGSGLGHLSRYLTYGCSLNLTCIDSVDRFGTSATKFDAELEQFLSKRGTFKSSHPPSHLCLKLEMNKHENELQRYDNFGIIGLHSCGNLGPVIIHNYVNSPAKFVVSVGCCYMKLDKNGFPLSTFGKNAGLEVKYEALEVACQAIEQYCQSLQDGQVLKLMTHAYRATLETVLVEHFSIRRGGLRGVRNCEKMSFYDYAIEAVKNLKSVSLTQEQLSGDKIEKMLQNWYELVLFYSIRVLIANVTETLIILDRAIFIKENVKESIVKVGALFDPNISPRNLAIISER